MHKAFSELVKNFGELNQLTKDLDSRIKYDSLRERALIFYRNHQNDQSLETMIERLRWVANIQHSSISKIEQVAEQLIKIPNLFGRINAGDKSVIKEVAIALQTRKDGRFQKHHFLNAITLCALANPEEYVSLSKGSFEIIQALSGREELWTKSISSVSQYLSLYDDIKSIIGVIKRDWKNLSFKDIDSTLLSIWVVLTDERVVEAIVNGTISMTLSSLGIPVFLSKIISKFLSLGLVDVLGPTLREYHNKQKNKLINKNNKKV